MTRSNATQDRLRVAALSTRAPNSFDLRPDEAARAKIAEELGLLSLRKLRLAGQIVAEGRDSWRMQADLGASVTQPCVVTLEPVSTRIDEPVERVWRPAEMLGGFAEGSETELPDDDIEPLPDTIDLRAILIEALSLALPLYPHAPGAEAAASALDDAAAPEPEDEKPNPFAALQGLRDRLSGDEDDGGTGGDDD